MKKRIPSLLALCGMLVFSQASFGATRAADNASDPVYANALSSSGSFNGLNGGTGFLAWSTSGGDGGTNGAFFGNYVGNTGGLGSPSFGIYSGDVNTGAFENAVRPFNGAMTAGQTFSVDLGHSAVGANGLIGLSLQNGAGTTRINLQTDGTNWALNDGGSNFNIAPDANNTPFHFTLTYNGTNSYSFTFTGGAGGSNFTAANTISDISQVNFFDFQQGAGQNFGFNNLAVPEPSSFALMSAAGVAGVAFLRRRRS